MIYKPVRFQILLDADQRQKLRELRQQTGIPVSYTIRKAVDAYLATMSSSGQTTEKGEDDAEREAS